ncbi:MAG: HAMP domain-containing histidine kinase [Hyphomicrobiales bacterium]|nr:HAMP domain-containing histidine kinase [Hyphomicrobiales bacterium]
MRRGALQIRLLLGGAVVIVFALVVVGIGLIYLFERHVTRRLEADLTDHLRLIAASVFVDENGEVGLSRDPGDPDFEVPLSGLYWQVGAETGAVLIRSASLWDVEIALPKDIVPDGAVHRHTIDGPDGSTLIAVERRVGLERPGDSVLWLRLVAAADRRIVTDARAEFRTDAGLALGLLAVVLIAAGWLQLRIGLGPLIRLGERVAEIRSGRSSRLGRDVPDEVIPLVDEINALLDLGDRTVERSRRRASDLAHGLKTPLTALSGDIRRLRERSENDIADDLESLAAAMRHHIDHELARARIGLANVPGAQAEIRTVVDAVLRTLKRTPAGERLAFEVDIPSGLTAPLDRADLTELLGNILDNAVRYARDGRCRMGGRRGNCDRDR